MPTHRKQAILGVVVFFLAGCAGGGSVEEQIQQGVEATITAIAPTETPIPSPTLPATATATARPTSAPTTETAILVRAVDGDTIDVRFADGTVDRVRLIGMDTPERGEPCYEIATAALALFEGLEVTLERDVTDRDIYERLLRYVYFGDSMLNEDQLLSGWARIYTFPPNVRYVERFIEAQLIAQGNGYGQWGSACDATGGGPIILPTGVSGGTWSFPGTCSGPDLDCANFTSHAQAQAFFEMCGGPSSDPHRLDGDYDGIACESLP